MKKVMLLSLVFLLAIAGSAFAAALADDAITATDGLQVYGGVNAADAAGGTSVLLGKMSKGVYFRGNSDVDGFAAGTKHASGSKAYGTASDSTAIYFQDVGQTGDVPTLTATNNDSFGTGWTNM